MTINFFHYRHTRCCNLCAKPLRNYLPSLEDTFEAVCVPCAEEELLPHFKALLASKVLPRSSAEVKIDGEDLYIWYNDLKHNMSDFVGLLSDEDFEVYQAKLLELEHPMYHCEVCLEDIYSIYPRIDAAGHAVCLNCFDEGIEPLFKAAMLDEQNYPPKWGTSKIEIAPFLQLGLMESAFGQSYQQREREYSVPLKDRVYCAGYCSPRRFVGKSTKDVQQSSNCPDCNLRTCLACRVFTCPDPPPPGPLTKKYLLPTPEAFHHSCETFGNQDQVTHRLPEATRGKEWQTCAGCGVLATLQDGCNHVVCSLHACKTSYCFLCGQKAEPASGHWRSSCPRYGQPQGRNGGIWDTGAVDGEDSEDESIWEGADSVNDEDSDGEGSEESDFDLSEVEWFVLRDGVEV